MAEPIAIVGLSCLLPDADDPQAFWQNLLAEHDAIVAPLDDALTPFFRAGKGQPDHACNVLGGWRKDIVLAEQDFTLPPGLLPKLDRPFRWVLHTGAAALRDSGIAREQRQRTGLVLGGYSWSMSRQSVRLLQPLYMSALQQGLQQPLAETIALEPDANTAPHNAFMSGMVASLAAEGLGLGGPHYALDAACASSLYCLKLAALHLHAGQADVMLAGGVSAYHPVFGLLGFAALQALPDQARSRPLDSQSDGLAAGEGAVMFVLKRLSDARRDGDTVYALLRGVGLSNDGGGRHLLVPSAKGQLRAYQRAYHAAGVSVSEVDYIDCHATGTKLGDKTELESLTQFFGKVGCQPWLGSAKSNVGHLLAAAGLVGALKTVLAMRSGTIPASIGIRTPLPEEAAQAEHIVRHATPWPESARARQAAVNAFGFGGTNAHLILQQDTLSDSTATPLAATAPLAIIGMDGVFGACADLEAFRLHNYAGKACAQPIPQGRWYGLEQQATLPFSSAAIPHGAYLEHFQIDALRFHLPPDRLSRFNPLPLLMLKVADAALQDAGIAPGTSVAVLIANAADLSAHRLETRWEMTTLLDSALQRVGLVVSAEQRETLLGELRDSLHLPVESTDFPSYIGNLTASRIASLWDFSGPAFTVSAEENSVFRALDIARLLLAEGEVEAVLVGAVDLAASVESVLVRTLLTGVAPTEPSFAFADGVNGWSIGEGAGAIVLQNLASAQQAGRKIHAQLDAVALASNNSLVQALEQACHEALTTAEREPQALGYWEAHASGIPAEDEAEMQVARCVFAEGNSSAALAVGSAKTLFGHSYVAAGMAGLLRTVLALRDGYLPATPGWLGPKSAINHPAFFVPAQAMPWLIPAHRARAAAVTSLARGSAACVLLSETPNYPAPLLQKPGADALRLLVIGGTDRAALQAGLQQYLTKLAQGTDIDQLSVESLRAHDSCAPLVLCLVAADAAQLERESQAAQTALANPAIDTWRTPTGSCFIAKPLGPQAGVAFVYPAVDTAYVGMQPDLFQLFPQAAAKLRAHVSDPRTATADEWLHPRFLHPATAREKERCEEHLRASLRAMLQASVAYPMLATWGLREALGLQASHAFGFSLGELTMLFALDVWTPGDVWLDKLYASNLLQEKLGGPCLAVNDYFGETVTWSARVVLAEADAVRAAIGSRQDVFIAQICAEREVVICGKDQACSAIVTALACDAFQPDFNLALHCPPAATFAAAFAEHFNQPSRAPNNTRLLFATGQQPSAWTADAVAEIVAAGVAAPVDFPHTIREAYADGARVFIELGPRNTCTRRIKAVLGDAPHEAIAFDQRGTSAHDSLVKLTATLLSQRIPLDLAHWPGVKVAPKKMGLPRTISVLGPMIAETVAKAVSVDLTPKPAEPPTPVIPTKSSLGNVSGLNVMPAPPPSAAASTSVLQQLAAVAQQTAQVHKALLANHSRSLRLSLGLLGSGSDEAGGVRDNRPQVPPFAKGGLGGILETEHSLVECKIPLNPPFAKGEAVNSTTPLYPEAAVMEFTEGRVAPVFGPEYADIDALPRRIRLPSPPFLALSRVTQLQAQPFSLEPCSIATEFDIPKPSWYGVDGQVPYMAVDAQGVLFLLGYLGIDRLNQGQRVYRWLDAKMYFSGLVPYEGQTVHYDIQIRSFVKHRDTLLFFTDFTCDVDGQRVLDIKDCCAGFFTDEELRHGQGITAKHEQQRKPNTLFVSPLACTKTAFNNNDLTALQHGQAGACFGSSHAALVERNPSLRLPPGPMRMVDRIVSVNAPGHGRGGQLHAEKDLHPDDWYLRCHFKDSPVFAGPCMLEGCFQLLQFYALYLGLPQTTTNARFAPYPSGETRVRFRSQVPAETSVFTTRMQIIEVGLAPRPYLIADFDLLHHGIKIGRIENLGLCLLEAGRPE